MLSREQLIKIQTQLEAALALVMNDREKRFEAAELMMSITAVIAARQAL